jgi:hypothetical protein
VQSSVVWFSTYLLIQDSTLLKAPLGCTIRCAQIWSYPLCKIGLSRACTRCAACCIRNAACLSQPLLLPMSSSPPSTRKSTTRCSGCAWSSLAPCPPPETTPPESAPTSPAPVTGLGLRCRRLPALFAGPRPLAQSSAAASAWRRRLPPL